MTRTKIIDGAKSERIADACGVTNVATQQSSALWSNESRRFNVAPMLGASTHGDLLAQWVLGLWGSGRISAAEAVAAGELVDQLRRLERDANSALAMAQAMSSPNSVVSPKLVPSGPPCGVRSTFFVHDWLSREGRPIPASNASKRDRDVQHERRQWTKPLDELIAERRRAA